MSRDGYCKGCMSCMAPCSRPKPTKTKERRMKASDFGIIVMFMILGVYLFLRYTGVW